MQGITSKRAWSEKKAKSTMHRSTERQLSKKGEQESSLELKAKRVHRVQQGEGEQQGLPTCIGNALWTACATQEKQSTGTSPVACMRVCLRVCGSC